MLFSRYKIKSKNLIFRKKKNGGRNNNGRITVAHQGGGHIQLYRKINFKENSSTGTVLNIEYDPNRSAYIAKICFLENNLKKYFYILSPQNLKILDKIQTSKQNYINNFEKIETLKQVGSFYLLNEFKIGDFIYNIETSPNKGGQLVRSAGTFAQVLQKDDKFATVILPSGEHRLIPLICKACFGNVSNDNHKNIIIGKAGRSRWLNKRPTVRGVAMNPIDHPHGGNTSGGIHPKTPWARLTKGKPTRSLKKKNKFIIKSYKK